LERSQVRGSRAPPRGRRGATGPVLSVAFGPRFCARLRRHIFDSAILIGEHIQLVTFELREDFTRARENRRRKSREPRDLYAVRLRRAPALNLVKEYHLALALCDADTVVLRAGQTLRQLRQLVVVGREQGLRGVLRRVVQVLCDGPSDGESVEGGRA